MKRTILLLSAVLLVGVAAQDPKFDLKWKRVAGQETNVTVKSEVALDITMKDSQGTKSQEIVLRSQDEFVQKVEKVAADRAAEMLVRCTKSTRQVGVQGEPSAINGRSFVVRRSARASTVEAEGGGTVPLDAQSLGGWEDSADLLPGSMVAAGSQWKVDAADVTGMISVVDAGRPKGEISVTLDSLKDNIATLSFSGAFEGVTADGFEAKVTVEKGVLILDTNKAAPVSLSFSGGFELLRKVMKKRRIPRIMEDGTEAVVQVEEEVGSVLIKSRSMTVSVTFE
ncbi:MAG: hypothetical protein ACYTAF_11440 [Planctomycetota bacterium]|jgi:hypothetical protein